MTTTPSRRPARPASLPPRGLPGLDPAWSRLVPSPDADGRVRTWHVLDTAPDAGADGPGVRGTLLCVHGNPTWSYLWRDLVARGAAAGWRVVAVDQLEMGYSERTGVRRGLAHRVRDLGALVETLGLTGDVVAVGHDWGGVIATGWAAAEDAHARARAGAPAGRHRAVERPRRLAGLVVMNTAAAHPAEDPAPGPLRLATLPGVLPLVTSRTDAFLRTTLALTHPPLAADVRAAYRAPYRGAADRAGVEDFVADVPVGPAHASRPAIDEVAAGAERLGRSGLPALVLWGPRDPVFGEEYLRDWRRRLPGADVHRFEGAGHLLPEDADVAGAVLRWLDTRLGSPAAPPAEEEATAPEGSPHVPLWTRLDERADSAEEAVVEMGPDGVARRVPWSLLHRRTQEIAAGLLEFGVEPGQRVSLLVPPGADLTAAVYAVVRIGAVGVLADAGLGLRGLTRAVRGAGVDVVIGVSRALVGARVLGWPGRRVAAGPVADEVLRLTGTRVTLADLAALGARRLAEGVALPPAPEPSAEAVVLFTSGSTGPAKGVVYTHRQLSELAAAMGATIRIGPGQGLVSAFAPFALFGPALGATCVVPAMDVTRPATLTASALAAAVAASGSTSAFLSPAALVNVLATADALDDADRAALARVQVLLSAGAPVPDALLQRARTLMPLADPRSPYGATEVLPATDVSLDEVLAAGAGEGICVGRPVEGAVVAIAPLDADGHAGEQLVLDADVTGEVVVGASHVKDHYDQLWLTQADSVAVRAPAGAAPRRWHRTGDVGHLDAQGRVWIEGRLAHVVVTGTEVVTPVGVEQRAESVPGIARAALVGVGPRPARQLAVVAEASEPVARTSVADPELAEAVRTATGRDLVAVLLVPALPTDVRHNSKIDRVRVAAWAGRALAGERVPPLVPGRAGGRRR
ncbi:alpha/beta fold hydrolase [Kineococcus siccus]|uniref:alpha/beta fold hydrolase n=1 Tax=Kineococcus siccus TaxID=2696567 RepID=UPI00196A53A1